MKTTNSTMPDKWESGKIAGFYAKNLLQLENGSVKMVKISPKAVYPEHLHPHKTEYAFVVEGHPVFEIDGATKQAGPGTFQVFPINSHHKISNPTDIECVLLIGAIECKPT